MCCSCKFICIYKQLCECVNDKVLRISETLFNLSSPIFESKYCIYIIGIVLMSRYDGISYSQIVIETLIIDVGIVNAKDETDYVMMFTEYCCHMFLMEFCSKNAENVGRLRC